MPFEKQPSTDGCEGMGLRPLLLAAFLLSIALLFAAIGTSLAKSEDAGVIAEVVQNEAIHAFLGIDTGA